MTEAEWLSCDDPWHLLHLVEHLGPSERKTRLFCAAVCRRFWDYLPEASQAILLESEMLADGLVPRPPDDMELCQRANAVVAPFDRQYPTKKFPNTTVRTQRDAAAAVCYAVIPDLFGAVSYFWELKPAERAIHLQIIRDIFGNPFRAAVADPSWLAPGVVELAQTIYDERAFNQLLELAVALEGVGCHDADVLAHCRHRGPHVRGCWIVDLILGKS
jgi:hypothetical protein